MSTNKQTNARTVYGGKLSRLALAPLALAFVGGCGDDVEAFSDIGTTTAAFKTYNAHDTDFIAQMPQVVSDNSLTGAFGPAMCSNSGHAAYLFVRDRQDFVQTYLYSGANPNGWTRYGNSSGNASPKTFSGRLSCAASGEGAQVVLVGRGKSDNLLYWSAAVADDALSNPVSESFYSFDDIHSTHTYTNDPSIAAYDGHLLVTVVGSTGRLYAYYKDGGGSWSGRISGPVSPDSGWTLQGTPSAAYHEGAEQYHIYVRATNSSGSSRFYRIYFDDDHFTGPFSLSSPIIQQVALSSGAPTIDSDPAVEWTGEPYGSGLGYVMTLYYRSGNKFYQSSSSIYAGDNPFELLSSSSHNPNFTGDPAVQGGVPYESGQHWFVGQSTSNRIYFGTSSEDVNLSLTGPDCADGAPAQVFGDYTPEAVGCPGSVTWSQRASLCAPGSRPCTADEWVDARGSSQPAHNYWTNDNLRYGGSSVSCFASKTSGTLCPSGQPMRVCTSSGTDAEGNVCNWENCGYNATSPNQYFGGCSGNTTAGTLCCLD